MARLNLHGHVIGSKCYMESFIDFIFHTLISMTCPEPRTKNLDNLRLMKSSAKDKDTIFFCVRHEVTWGSGVVSPLILKFSMRWRMSGQLNSQTVLLQVERTQYPFNSELGRPHIQYGCFGKG